MKVSSLQVPGAREEYSGNTHPFKPRGDGASAKETEGKGVCSCKSQFVANRPGCVRKKKEKDKENELRAG